MNGYHQAPPSGARSIQPAGPSTSRLPVPHDALPTNIDAPAASTIFVAWDSTTERGSSSVLAQQEALLARLSFHKVPLQYFDFAPFPEDCENKYNAGLIQEQQDQCTLKLFRTMCERGRVLISGTRTLKRQLTILDVRAGRPLHPYDILESIAQLGARVLILEVGGDEETHRCVVDITNFLVTIERARFTQCSVAAGQPASANLRPAVPYGTRPTGRENQPFAGPRAVLTSRQPSDSHMPPATSQQQLMQTASLLFQMEPGMQDGYNSYDIPDSLPRDADGPWTGRAPSLAPVQPTAIPYGTPGWDNLPFAGPFAVFPPMPPSGSHIPPAIPQQQRMESTTYSLQMYPGVQHVPGAYDKPYPLQCNADVPCATRPTGWEENQLFTGRRAVLPPRQSSGSHVPPATPQQPPSMQNMPLPVQMSPGMRRVSSTCNNPYPLPPSADGTRTERVPVPVQSLTTFTQFDRPVYPVAADSHYAEEAQGSSSEQALDTTQWTPTPSDSNQWSSAMVALPPAGLPVYPVAGDVPRYIEEPQGSSSEQALATPRTSVTPSDSDRQWASASAAFAPAGPSSALVATRSGPSEPARFIACVPTARVPANNDVLSARSISTSSTVVLPATRSSTSVVAAPIVPIASTSSSAVAPATSRSTPVVARPKPKGTKPHKRQPKAAAKVAQLPLFRSAPQMPSPSNPPVIRNQREIVQGLGGVFIARYVWQRPLSVTVQAPSAPVDNGAKRTTTKARSAPPAAQSSQDVGESSTSSQRSTGDHYAREEPAAGPSNVGGKRKKSDDGEEDGESSFKKAKSDSKGIPTEAVEIDLDQLQQEMDSVFESKSDDEESEEEEWEACPIP